MAHQVSPSVLVASRVAVAVVDAFGKLLIASLVFIGWLLSAVIDVVFYALSNSRQRAKMKAEKRHAERLDRVAKQRARQEFEWRARTTAKAQRDYGRNSGSGFISKLSLLIVWASILYVTFWIVLPHALS